MRVQKRIHEGPNEKRIKPMKHPTDIRRSHDKLDMIAKWKSKEIEIKSKNEWNQGGKSEDDECGDEKLDDGEKPFDESDFLVYEDFFCFKESSYSRISTEHCVQ